MSGDQRSSGGGDVDEGRVTTGSPAGGVEDFEPHRRYLAGMAYRMLGSVAEAEDVVQDAFLRWSSGAGAGEVIEAPRAYLARVVTRLCLDRLKSARARREQYVGTWLPEPLIEPMEGGAAATSASAAAGGGKLAVPGQEAALTLAEDLSFALLVTLETLSPLERAAFLLHDIFDMDFAQIAGVLERSEAAVRQLAARARAHVRDGRPRFSPPPVADRLHAAFHAAASRGEMAALTELLAEDAVLYSDGGGKRRAALNPIYGRDKILRFFIGVGKKIAATLLPTEIEWVHVNGMPGFLMRGPEGPETMALEIVDGRIVAIYIIRNPDKLRHVT